MKELLREVVWAAAIVIIVMTLSGCGTVRGFGGDLQDASDMGRAAIKDYAARQ